MRRDANLTKYSPVTLKIMRGRYSLIIFIFGTLHVVFPSVLNLFIIPPVKEVVWGILVSAWLPVCLSVHLSVGEWFLYDKSISF